MPQIGESDSCEDGEPRITTVHILDGKNDTYVSGDRNQYVNLPKDAKWVDESVGLRNEDRLGQTLRIKVEFDQPGAHEFTLKMVPDECNVEYTGAEEGRNPNFLYQKEEKSYTTDGDGTKLIEDDFFFVTCGGYDVFTLDATGGCNTASSMAIEVKRFFYVVEMKMRGAACASSIGPVESVYRGHGIKIESLPSVEMPRMENIGSDAEFRTFLNSARAAYGQSEGPSKEPYVMAIAYTDHLAKKTSGQTVSKTGVTVGPSAPPVTIPLVDAGGQPHFLWHKIVTGEGWFVAAQFTDTEGTVTSIEKRMVSGVPGGGPSEYAHREVAVDVTGLPDGTGTLSVTVDWIYGMRAGASFKGTRLIAVCTRGYWQAVLDTQQQEIMVHEMGHKVGMVANGTGKAPDKPEFYYTGHGHDGPHCHNGVTLVPRLTSSVGATCIMFGKVNGNMSYCEACEPAVKKVDLSEGWSAW